MKNKTLKIKKLRSRPACRQAGMTYVELIVVLSIFAIMSSIVIFNYQGFQAKVDIKNLASDIALKIVEAQKSSINGVLPPLAKQLQTDSTWKPSYGVYFDITSNPKSFIYFTDLNDINNVSNTQNSVFDDSSCTGECLDEITITRNDYIEKIESCTGSTPSCFSVTGSISITFKRPDVRAIIRDSNGSDITGDYVQIVVKSSNGEATGIIKVYPSGRIQVD